MENRITINDARQSGFCVKGAKKWFDDRGMSFKDFLRDGMSMEDAMKLYETDGIARKIIDDKAKRESNGR